MPAVPTAAADPWARESAGVAQPVPPLHLVPLPTSAAMGPAPRSRLPHADEAVARLWTASPLHPPERAESSGQGNGPPSPTGNAGIKRGLHAAAPRLGESQSCSSTATSSTGGSPLGVTSGFLQVRALIKTPPQQVKSSPSRQRFHAAEGPATEAKETPSLHFWSPRFTTSLSHVASDVTGVPVCGSTMGIVVSSPSCSSHEAQEPGLQPLEQPPSHGASQELPGKQR